MGQLTDLLWAEPSLPVPVLMFLKNTLCLKGPSGGLRIHPRTGSWLNTKTIGRSYMYADSSLMLGIRPRGRT
jgi:hypothetical protein